MDINSRMLDFKGIGPKKNSRLEKLDIFTALDLINYYPRGYAERTNYKKIIDVLPEEEVLIEGRLLQLVSKGSKYRKGDILTLLIDDGTARAEIVFFNAKYIKSRFQYGEIYAFFGKANINKHGRVNLIHPEFFKGEAASATGIIPIYPLTMGISQAEMRKWQAEAQNLIQEVKEYLPAKIIKENRLCSINYALRNIHYPESRQKLKEARFRLIFEEFFFLELMLLSSKKIITEKKCIEFSKEERCADFIASLPFNLTPGQERTVSEVLKDMSEKKVMNRLIQGDVGSGKTVVAEIALYKAVKDGYQGVIMAPTEILAQQHYAGIKKAFAGFDINVGFISGSQKLSERKKILEDLANGKIQVIVGTHAVISNDVHFNNLGLVITDEQHRFGVNQRKLLGAKGHSPDTLVMTATPIPRTLAVILYGELDISIIDSMPEGRQKITTRAIEEKDRQKAYDFMLSEVKKGRQCYIVAPLIEDSDNLELRSAESIYEEVKGNIKGIRSALLHGEMKQKEKDSIMKAFNEGELDVLVSTVVIEVGINVPNATLMIIENAERFGLAQLHQLRGRVGRGSHKSYCILVNNGTTDVSKERAKIMESTSDGFIISEKDLELRGPGEFFGTRQHGIPEFKLASLTKHIKIFELAKQAAMEVLSDENSWQSEEYMLLKQRLDDLYNLNGKNPENSIVQI